MIEVEGLTKNYGDFTAIEGLNFAVKSGEVVGFLGANGAGKTTTLRILSCFIPPSSGVARVAGFDVVKQSMDVRKRIGYLPESVPLYPELRVTEYLRFRARLKDIPASKRNVELDRVMERSGIKDSGSRIIGALSRGYRQRVGLADALLGSPQVLVLDEPTSGLDPLQRLQVRALIGQLKGEQTIFLSTHILPEVESIASRVIMLRKGRLVPDEDFGKWRGRSCLEVFFKGEASAVKGALEKMDGVAQVEDAEVPVLDGEPGERGVRRLRIYPHPQQDPRAELTQLFAARQTQGWQLMELHRRTMTLEEMFARASGEGD